MHRHLYHMRTPNLRNAQEAIQVMQVYWKQEVIQVIQVFWQQERRLSGAASPSGALAMIRVVNCLVHWCHSQ